MGGSGGAAAPPPDLGQMANFWVKEAIFGHSWHAQKRLSCPKIAKLSKNFGAAKLQPPPVQCVPLRLRTDWAAAFGIDLSAYSGTMADDVFPDFCKPVQFTPKNVKFSKKKSGWNWKEYRFTLTAIPYSITLPRTWNTNVIEFAVELVGRTSPIWWRSDRCCALCCHWSCSFNCWCSCRSRRRFTTIFFIFT